MATTPGRRFTLVQSVRLDAKWAAYINRILLSAASELDSDLRRLGSAGSPLGRAQMEAARAAIKSHMNQDWSDIYTAVAAGQRDAAASASRVVSQYENVLLQTGMTPAEMREYANGLAEAASSRVNTVLARLDTSHKALSSQVYETKALVSGWVDSAVNVSLARGETAAQLAARVRKFVSPNTPGGASYAARRLARTEINNAFHATTIDRYQKSGIVEEVDWNLSSSHPEGDECDDLKDNSPYNVDMVPEKPHPQCFCFITPALPSRSQFMENLFAGKYDDEDWASAFQR